MKSIKNVSYFIKLTFNRVMVIVMFVTLCCSCKPYGSKIPNKLSTYVSQIEFDSLDNLPPKVIYESLSDSLIKVSLSWELTDTVKQDNWQTNIYPAFQPDFHWAPHLTPTNEHVIPQHVFRAPALVVSSPNKQLTIIPDLETLSTKVDADWYMDLNAVDNILSLGMSQTAVSEHVLYSKKQGKVYVPDKVEFGFYIMVSDSQQTIFDPWRKILSFFWTNFGKELYEAGQPLAGGLEPYVDHAYNWAFNNWKESVWQEFQWGDKQVGAPIFIVNVTKSPNYSGEPKNREFISIWNQAWFNSLRSASGLYRYAKRTGDESKMAYARMTKELALSFPQRNGFFHAVIAPSMTANNQPDWQNFNLGNSNRNPYTWDALESPYHILDMSYTALQMLYWYSELEADERLLDYAISYGEALIALQSTDGFFPAWLSLNDLTPMTHLNQSPETSMSVTFLLKLYALTEETKYLTSALQAIDAVVDHIIPVGQWEDFETYWSCSRYGSEDLVGKKVTRNNMFKQNNFSIYWTAEALLKAYQATGDQKYLQYGQRTLDELLMYQASWQPPYMYVNTLGGFGVMNADAEWNDSRQSLFAELIVAYGQTLDQQEYVQRGLAALKASFVMMYCPENPTTKVQWEKRWPFFNMKDYGFMMENYGHDGVTSPDGVGIGEFTIYDWGNGAAAEAYNRMYDHFGKLFLTEN